MEENIVQDVVEEKKEISAEEQAKLEAAMKALPAKMANKMFHQATRQHSVKNRGVGVTRKSHAKTAKQRKMAKASRKINRKS